MICKICDKESLVVFAHTARCKSCEALLFYPYPESDDILFSKNEKGWAQDSANSWYYRTSFYNHVNFTNMLRFTMSEGDKGKAINILDYGGRGGQFALVCKSHFPESKVSIVDIADEALLHDWASYNAQIKFKDFPTDTTKFDFIFLNDVFEHVSDPNFVLNQLREKLKDNGKIFIDTPKQFWLYPVLKVVNKTLYRKLLQATVSASHLQIWSNKSFNLVVKESKLKIAKYKLISEYTMPASHYLNGMKIKSKLIWLIGLVYYNNAKLLAKNKIITVLEKV